MHSFAGAVNGADHEELNKMEQKKFRLNRPNQPGEIKVEGNHMNIMVIVVMAIIGIRNQAMTHNGIRSLNKVDGLMMKTKAKVVARKQSYCK
ncbi:hypothetical protein COLO4_21509 [Corchorus olitorius]|uniref:Uncharacterized protein n=1 Tax=Corchorus olitorius TaxID=93759 RepID=A0A1R3ISV2_9ROSI|nr:hypothetical protein COLO4_21509 [Corchorus olitorius]